jgi:hypothetical protein
MSVITRVSVTSVWINLPRGEVALFNPRMPRPQQRPHLRLVTYKLTGHNDSSETGDVLSLLLHCPFSFMARVIPPMSVVNDFLVSAANDQSMSGGGCTWKPFHLDDGEYRDLVNALKKRRFKSVIPPRWVRTHRDWGTWCGEIVWGVPAAKARRMKKRIAALEQEIEASDRSDEQVAKLLKRLMAMNVEWARYFSENCSRKPRIPLLRVLENHGS